MSDNRDADDMPRVEAPDVPAPDVGTVPRGGGAPITDDDLQHDNDTPEGTLRVTHTEAARAAERGESPYGGLAPDRPNRSTLDNSVGEGVVDDHY